MAAADEFPVRVLFEREDLDNPWQDHVWRTVGVLPGSQDVSVDVGALVDARIVHEEEGRKRYLSDDITIELFRKETEGYKLNLSQPVPKIYVVLRPFEDDDASEGTDAPDVEVFHVTVCPYEGESYTEGDDATVDGVPMPNDIVTRLQAFVDTHHVDVPFKKRKRDKKNPNVEKGWGRPAKQGPQ